MLHPQLIAIVAALVVLLTPPVHAAQTPTSSGNGVLAKCEAPMVAVARLLTEQAWNVRFDRMIQETPAAKPLGNRWVPTSPAWQQARKALGSRMTRILDAYVRSGDAATVLATEFARIAAPPGPDELKAALSGPASDAIVRRQALLSFVVLAMSDDPNSPQPGQPAWRDRMASLTQLFDDRLASVMPVDPGMMDAELAQYAAGAAGQFGTRLWQLVIGKITTKLNTGINLMLFDDQAAILRDIAAAVSGGA